MNHKLRTGILFVFFIILSTIVVLPLVAQEPILASYKRNFARANLATKTGILRDASTDERASEFIGPLYEFALRFALQHADILKDDPDMIALTVYASRGIGNAGYQTSVNTLWTVFMTYRDSVTRVEVLNALALLGKGNTLVVENLNQFLANQNNLYRSGMVPDYPTLLTCITTLSALGDGSSFPVLFSAMVASYPEAITQAASKALSSIEGDYKNYLIDVMKRNPPVEKLTAFRAGVQNEHFSEAELGDLAETALTISLELFPANAESESAVTRLRYESIDVLKNLKWARATPLLIRHFYRVQTDYSNNIASKPQFLGAIAALGVMGSSEAAQVLALQLGLQNSQMERNNEFDDAITLGVVDALGELGDKIAFDYLLYIGYLPYPESIQNAAREALNRLKW